MTTTSPEPSRWFARDWFAGLLLVAAVLVAYIPVIGAGFVWDDVLLAGSAQPPPLSAIWTTSAADNCPLTRTTFWLERSFWGVEPLPYHVVDVLLHAGCAIMLWIVLRRLRVPAAWLGAALWALHPVQAESAAWISETKNTQSGLFFLLCIYFFIRMLEQQGGTTERRDYWIGLLFAALAIASKASAVILPATLCLCFWWVEGRWRWRTMAKVAPVILFSIASSLETMWITRLQLTGSRDPVLHPEWVRSLPERLIAAGDAVWFYLGKLIWPRPLIAIYPRWQIDARQWAEYLPLLGVFAVLWFLWLKRNTWARPWFFAFAWFLVALLPVLGLVEQPIMHYSFVFDHFQYLASMAPLALAGAGIGALCVRFSGPRKTWLPAVAMIPVLLIIGGLTVRRAMAFQNEETLWSDTVAKNPRAWMAHNNLANALMLRGQSDEAMAHYQRALELNLNYAEAHNGAGVVLAQRRRYEDAIAQFHIALELSPEFTSAEDNLAKAQELARRSVANLPDPAVHIHQAVPKY